MVRPTHPTQKSSSTQPKTTPHSPADEARAASVNDGASPYTIVTLPSEAVARALQARCIMADRVVELWGHGGWVMNE